MKKLLSIALVLAGYFATAQEFVTCDAYNQYGDFEKAKTCLQSMESRFGTSPAFYYHKMRQALRSGDGANATKIYESIGTYPQDDFHIVAAKTIYLVYTKEINQAKAAYAPIIIGHKLAPVPVLLDVVSSFFSFRARDPEYALLWINMLEKELKAPHVGWLLLKGDYYASLGDHGVALNYYNQALDAEPTNVIALYKKAVAYRRIRNFTAALSELDNALKIKPEFPFAILEKGEVLFELNRADEGSVYYNEYFKMMPGDLLAHLQFGSSLYLVKKYAEASAEADRVLQFDSTNVSALKLKSYTSYELGKYPEGLIIMQTYLAKADTATIHSKDYEYLARFYLKTGNDTMAIEAFKKALQYPGAKAELYSESGALMIKKLRWGDAVNTYKSKLEKFPGTSADYYSYGLAASAIDSFLLADTLFAKVIEMQPNWPNGYLMRAKTNSHLDPGSTEGKALPYYEKYITIAEADTANFPKHKPGLIEAYKYLGYYYYLSNNKETSRSHWKKVLTLDPEDKQAKDVLKQL